MKLNKNEYRFFGPMTTLALVLLGLVSVGLGGTALYKRYHTEPGITWTDEIPPTAIITVIGGKEIVVHHSNELGGYCTEVWLKQFQDGERMSIKAHPEWDVFTAFALGYVDGYCTVYLGLDPALEGGQ